MQAQTWTNDKDDFGRSIVDFRKWSLNRAGLVTAERRFKTEVSESKDLPQLCSVLPDLEHVGLCDLANQSSKTKDSYLLDTTFPQRYGLSATKFLPRAFNFDTFEAIAKACPQVRIYLYQVSYGTVSNIGYLAPRAMQGISCIRWLNLAFSAPQESNFASRRTLAEFDHFFSSLDQIEELYLTFDVNHVHDEHVTRPLWTIVLRKHWPRIKTICLTDMTCSQQAFISFMSRHRETLKEVVIQDLRFHEPGTERWDKRCPLMQFIWTVPFVTRLDKFTLQGSLAVCDFEVWEVEERQVPHSENQMKNMSIVDNSAGRGNVELLEQYSVGKAPFPFPKLVGYFGFRKALALMRLSLLDFSEPEGADTVSALLGHADAQSACGLSVEETFEVKNRLLDECRDHTLSWGFEEALCKHKVRPDPIRSSSLIAGQAEICYSDSYLLPDKDTTH